MGHLSWTALLIALGSTFILGYIAYAILRGVPRRVRAFRANLRRHGPTYLVNRRNLILGGAGLIAGGVGMRMANGQDPLPANLGERTGNLTDGLPDADFSELGQPTGQREFNLSAGGYTGAEWLDDGRLRITFQDEPPMQEWYLVGPKPQRNVLASGTPPQFGGTRTVSLELPISTGEYLLTGAKLEADPDSLMGMEADRTGTARFSVEAALLVTAVEPASEDAHRATITLRNVGSVPYRVEGVKFGSSVTGTGRSNFMGFRSESPLLTPTNAVTLTSQRQPFYDPNTESQYVPDTFRLGIWAHEEEFWFEYTDGNLRAIESTPSG